MEVRRPKLCWYLFNFTQLIVNQKIGIWICLPLEVGFSCCGRLNNGRPICPHPHCQNLCLSPYVPTTGFADMIKLQILMWGN